MVDGSALRGKRALVTGGAIGIGREIVRALSQSGAETVFTWWSHQSEAEELARSINDNGGVARAICLDASKSAQVDAVITPVLEELAGLDLLVNNAGGLVARAPVAGMSDSHWQTVFDLNVGSAFYLCRVASPWLASGGRVVNVSSLAGLNGGGSGATAYAAAKAALLGFTRALAKEWAPRAITVNAVAPGFILDTPFHERFTPAAQQQSVIASIPLGRAGFPPDVSGAVVWLCSQSAAFVTGEVININGGAYFG